MTTLTADQWRVLTFLDPRLHGRKSWNAAKVMEYQEVSRDVLVQLEAKRLITASVAGGDVLFTDCHPSDVEVRLTPRGCRVLDELQPRAIYELVRCGGTTDLGALRRETGGDEMLVRDMADRGLVLIRARGLTVDHPKFRKLPPGFSVRLTGKGRRHYALPAPAGV